MPTEKEPRKLNAVEITPEPLTPEAILARYKAHSSRVLQGLMAAKQKEDPSFNWDKLARKLGIANSAMSLIKNGKMALSVQFLPIVAAEFNCDKTDLLPEENKPKRKNSTAPSRYLESDVTRAVNAVTRKLGQVPAKEAMEIAFEVLEVLPEYPNESELDEAIVANLLKSRRGQSN